jgi:hypothetical protein
VGLSGGFWKTTFLLTTCFSGWAKQERENIKPFQRFKKGSEKYVIAFNKNMLAASCLVYQKQISLFSR